MMSDQPQKGQRPIARSGQEHERPGVLTRRTVLAGAAAATAVATIADAQTPVRAQATNPKEDMVAFVLLSGILTGIAENKLAPGFSPLPPPTPISLQNFEPGSDPVNVKQEYFDWLREKRPERQRPERPQVPETFEKLLQIIRDNLGTSNRDQAVIDKVQAADDTRYLARSIVLMWYLGAWYQSGDLRTVEKDPKAPLGFQVISSNAYTQGWTLKVARAHPMGYSEMQFGYWNREPQPIKSFIGERTV